MAHVWKWCTSLLHRTWSCDSKQMNGNTAKSSNWLGSYLPTTLCYESTMQVFSGELAASATAIGQNLNFELSFTTSTLFFNRDHNIHNF